ncbi:MAG: double zinc ribbon domain-containing protein [Coriobacteriales bacterium]|nr:double zinc ribbon domain-containing protein [Coriobacteriales bacterium]
MLDLKKLLVQGKEALGETLLPTRCVGCGVMGQLLCLNCLKQVQIIDFDYACRRCGAPFGSLLCTECLIPGYEIKKGGHSPPHFLSEKTRCACVYEGIAKAILHAYKDAGERALCRYIATFICNAIKGCSSSVGIVAPTNKENSSSVGIVAPTNKENSSCVGVATSSNSNAENFRNCSHNVCSHSDWSKWADYLVQIPANVNNLNLRGFDHLLDVANFCSDWLDLPLISILSVGKVADQRKLDKQSRQRNMKNSFFVNEKSVLIKKSSRIILIDDVLTTGASLNAACLALNDAGFKQVRFVTFARVW